MAPPATAGAALAALSLASGQGGGAPPLTPEMAALSWPTVAASSLTVPAATLPIWRLPAVPATLMRVPLVAAPTVSRRLVAFCWTRPIVPLARPVLRVFSVVVLVVTAVPRLATVVLVAVACPSRAVRAP